MYIPRELWVFGGWCVTTEPVELISLLSSESKWFINRTATHGWIFREDSFHGSNAFTRWSSVQGISRFLSCLRCEVEAGRVEACFEIEEKSKQSKVKWSVFLNLSFINSCTLSSKINTRLGFVITHLSSSVSRLEESQVNHSRARILKRLQLFVKGEILSTCGVEGCLEHFQALDGSEPTLTQLLNVIEKEMWLIRHPRESGALILELLDQSGEELDFETMDLDYHNSDKRTRSVSADTTKETTLVHTQDVIPVSHIDQNQTYINYIGILPDEILIQIITLIGDNTSIQQFGCCSRRLFSLCEAVVAVSPQRYCESGVLYLHQMHALAWLRHRERRHQKGWRVRQCLPTTRVATLLKQNNGEITTTLDSIEKSEDFQILWLTDTADPLSFFSVYRELRLIPITSPHITRYWEPCTGLDNVSRSRLSCDQRFSDNKELFNYFLDHLHRLFVVQDEILYGLTIAPSSLSCINTFRSSDCDVVKEKSSMGNVFPQQYPLMTKDGSLQIMQLNSTPKFSLFINRAENRTFLGFSSSRRRKMILWNGGGFFCDEPGLGKTLSILSLVMKSDCVKTEDDKGRQDKKRLSKTCNSADRCNKVNLDSSGSSHEQNQETPCHFVSADFLEFFFSKVINLKRRGTSAYRSSQNHSEGRSNGLSESLFRATTLTNNPTRSAQLEFSDVPDSTCSNNQTFKLDPQCNTSTKDENRSSSDPTLSFSLRSNSCTLPEIPPGRSSIVPIAELNLYPIRNRILQKPDSISHRWGGQSHFFFCPVPSVCFESEHSPQRISVDHCDAGLNLASRAEDYRPVLPFPSEVTRLSKLVSKGDVLNESVLQEVEAEYNNRTQNDTPQSGRVRIVNDKLNEDQFRSQRQQSCNSADHQQTRKYRRVIQQLGSDKSWECFNYQNRELETYVDSAEKITRRSLELAEKYIQQRSLNGNEKTESNGGRTSTPMRKQSHETLPITTVDEYSSPSRSGNDNNSGVKASVYSSILSSICGIPECLKGTATLVVTPNNLLSHWEAEARKWLPPNLWESGRILVVGEHDKYRPTRFDLSSAILVITSHSVLAKESRFVLEVGDYEKAIELSGFDSECRSQIEEAIKSAVISYINLSVSVASQADMGNSEQLTEKVEQISNNIDFNLIEKILLDAFEALKMKKNDKLVANVKTISETCIKNSTASSPNIPTKNPCLVQALEITDGRVGEAFLWACWDFAYRCLHSACNVDEDNLKKERVSRQRRTTERYLMERWDRIGRAQKASRQPHIDSLGNLSLILSGLSFRFRSPFLSTQFERLVVDEGHQLSGSASLMSFRFMCHLVLAKKRWVVTGTPLSQDPETGSAQLQRLLEFIRHPSAFRFPYSTASPFSRLLRRTFNCSVHPSSSPFPRTPFSAENLNDDGERDDISLGSESHPNSKSRALITSTELGPGSLSVAFSLYCILNETLVIHSKSQLHQLPPLIGPTIYRLIPTENEMNSYNDLVELTQRNLFLTYFSRRNVSSLLHATNRSLATETLMNLHLACLCESSSHFTIKEEDAMETLDMLVKCKQEEAFAGNYNHNYYSHSVDRLEFVRQVLHNINNACCRYVTHCDLCQGHVRFPIIVPCPDIHLICTECLIKTSHRGAFTRRMPLSSCPVCSAEIHADFFDRLQPPVQTRVQFFAIQSRADRKRERQNLETQMGATAIDYSQRLSMSEKTFKTVVWTYSRFLVTYRNYDETTILDRECSTNRISSPVPLNGSKYSPLAKLSLLKTPEKPDSSAIEISTDLKCLNGSSPFYTAVPSVEHWLNDVEWKLHERSTDTLLLNSLASNSNDQDIFLFESSTVTNEWLRSNSIHVVHSSPSVFPKPPVQRTLSQSRKTLAWGDVEDIAVLKRSSKQRYISLRVRDIIMSRKFRQNNQPFDSEKIACPKIIIVSRFWEHLFLLGGVFEVKLGIQCAHLYPKAASHKTSSCAILDFQHRTDTPILLLHPTYGSHGLDLSCASHVLLLDPLPSINLEMQVISRAHRVGALRPVYVEQCVIKGTVEETILVHRDDWLPSKTRRNTNTSKLSDSIRKKKSTSSLKKKLHIGAGQGGQSHTIPRSAVMTNLPACIESSVTDTDSNESPVDADPDQLQVEWLLRTLRMIR